MERASRGRKRGATKEKEGRWAGWERRGALLSSGKRREYYEGRRTPEVLAAKTRRRSNPHITLRAALYLIIICSVTSIIIIIITVTVLSGSSCVGVPVRQVLLCNGANRESGGELNEGGICIATRPILGGDNEMVYAWRCGYECLCACVVGVCEGECEANAWAVLSFLVLSLSSFVLCRSIPKDSRPPHIGSSPSLLPLPCFSISPLELFHELIQIK